MSVHPKIFPRSKNVFLHLVTIDFGIYVAKYKHENIRQLFCQQNVHENLKVLSQFDFFIYFRHKKRVRYSRRFLHNRKVLEWNLLIMQSGMAISVVPILQMVCFLIQKKKIIFNFQVSVPSTGQLALDLMCGEWGASRCSAAKWFKYMGDAETNTYVPFQINYLAQSSSQPVNGHIPLDPIVTPCSEALDVSVK